MLSPSIVAAIPVAALLLLNELMIRPTAGGSEWVELLNAGDAPALLADLTLEDSRAKPARVTGAPAQLEPGAFLILAANRTRLLDAWIGLDAERVVAVTGGWPTLNDSDGEDGFADRIVLRGAGRVLLDSLTYGTAWVGAAGTSVERIDPAGGSGLAANWSPCAEAAGATPLARNSLAPRPGLDDRPGLSVPGVPFAPDGAAGPAVITWRLNTASDLSLEVFDLSGRSVRLLRPLEAASPVGRVAWDGHDDAGMACPSGVYLVLLESRADDGQAVRRWQRPLALVRGAR